MPADYLRLIIDDPVIKQIRTFIAIELPEDVKAHLGQLQDVLKTVDENCAKWVSPESIHLTLKFLGSVNVDKLNGIVDVMEETARYIPPFKIEIGEMGAFPNLKRVQTVWVGIKGNLEQLQSMQKALDMKLAKLGFPPDNRPFVPHLTLARVRDYAPPSQRLVLGETIVQSQIQSC